jgi:23S rRNA (adenine2503-C2)-methyltransferase
MGMGEPLANYDNVVTALRMMLDDNAYGSVAAPRHAVHLRARAGDRSPARGLPGRAGRLAACGQRRAARRLVPINRKYPLVALLAACVRYLDRAPRDFVTFEYVMLDGVNDSAEQAQELAALVRDVPCKFNLIPWNPFPGADFKTSPAPGFWHSSSG